jgi:hypothetical protein
MEVHVGACANPIAEAVVVDAQPSRSPRSYVTRQAEKAGWLGFRAGRLRALLLPSRSISLYSHVGERVIAVFRLQPDLVDRPIIGAGAALG